MAITTRVCPECGESSELSGECPRDGTTFVPQGEDTLLGTTIGSYRVARLLGQGGMGRVYKGVQPSIGSRVAIKVLATDVAQNRDIVERFFAEARAVNLIRHESIVNVLDLALLPDGRPYIVMEYLDGMALSSVIVRRGALPLGSFARAMGECLDALGAAHAKQIVHRDLKPDNIYISPAGRAKVLDFGIAKLIPELSGRSGPTRTGSVLGTPHYMSPEQALAENVDARTDLYSLGCILFEGVTGKLPFHADSLFGLLRKHIEVTPPAPRSLRADLPPEYEAVILRAMEKDPAKRFQTAAELAHGLAEATQALPPEAWASIGSQSGPVAAAIGPTSGSGRRSGVPAVTPSSAPATVPSAPPVPYATTVSAASAEMASPASTTAARTGTTGRLVFVLAAVVLGAAVLGGGAVALFRTGGEDDVSAEEAEARSRAIADRLASKGDEPDEPEKGDEPDEADKGDEGDDEADTKGAVATRGERPGHSDDDDDDGPDTAGPTPDRDAASAKPGTAAAGRDPRPTTSSAERLTSGRAAERDPATAKGPRPATAVAAKTARAEAPLPDDPADEPDSPTASPAAPDRKRFDVTGYISKALARARKTFEDAVLVRIDADGVLPDGFADLTLDDSFSVTYRFVSPSRGKRPPDLPLGLDHKPTCLYYVTVEADEVSAYPLKGWKCDDYPLVGIPKCTVRGVWKEAISRGAPGSKAIAEVGYWADPSGKGRWHLSVKGSWSNWVEDSCGR